MSGCTDNQDVGLEAATIERVRNSSLVECDGTDNVTRLKLGTEARDCMETCNGRGAFSKSEKPDRKDWWRYEK